MNPNSYEMTPSDIKIIHTGFGTKKGSTVKSWKRRWFVLLSNGSLRYFSDKFAPDEKGRMEINKSTDIIISPSNQGEIPVQIINKTRTLMINFCNIAEAEEWAEKLNFVKDNLPAQ